MPVAGGPFIQKTGILLEVDSADKTSYSGTGTTWINQIRPGTNNGTLNNISFDSADAKGALVFTGSNTFVDFGNLGPSLTSSFSFQVAFKPAATASGQPYTILSYASASATSSITFKLDYTSSNQTVILSSFSNTGSQNIVYSISGSVTPGTWNIINGTYGSNVLALFKNGNLITSVPTTGSTVGYNANNRLYLGGTFGSTAGFFTGSIANLLVNRADLNIRNIAGNYNAFFSRFGLTKTPGLVTDFDAINFIEATGLSNETQAVAINNLVLGLKANNLWTKMQAIYPFVGGTAYTHKFNLKDPRDSDNAFRIQFFGAVTHNNLGVSASAAGYGDTKFRPATNFANVTSSLHASIYMSAGLANGSIFTDYGTQWNVNIRTLDISPVRIGESTSTNVYAAISAYTNTGYDNIIQTNAAGASTGLNRTGLWAATRTSSTLATAYRRSSVQNFTITSTNAFTGVGANNNMQLFRSYVDNGATTGGLFTFASLGEGLTTPEIDTLYTLVQAYQTTLGRQA
jgi:hypothetical protein